MVESQACITVSDSKEDARGAEREVAGVTESEKGGAFEVIEVVSGSDPEEEKVCRTCHPSEDLGKEGISVPETDKGASMAIKVVDGCDPEAEKVCWTCHPSADLGKEGTGVPETEKDAAVAIEVVGGSHPEAEKVCRIWHPSAEVGKEGTGVPETEKDAAVAIEVIGGSHPEAERVCRIWHPSAEVGKEGTGVPEMENGALTVIEIVGRSVLDEEKVCRICHLSADMGKEGAEMIQIGCRCKGELAVVHRHCAEAWFTVKGSRCCEICGANAKNITGVGDSKFMEKWHEGRSTLNDMNSPLNSRRSWKRRMFCNLLMVCLVAGFILPWLFRMDTF